jgi:hypothetical protein
MEVSGQSHPTAALLPGKEPLVPTKQEAGLAPRTVWTLWKREKSLVPAENRTPDVQLVAHRYTD